MTQYPLNQTKKLPEAETAATNTLFVPSTTADTFPVGPERELLSVTTDKASDPLCEDSTSESWLPASSEEKKKIEKNVIQKGGK